MHQARPVTRLPFRYRLMALTISVVAGLLAGILAARAT
jgi:hypothetical protein